MLASGTSKSWLDFDGDAAYDEDNIIFITNFYIAVFTQKPLNCFSSKIWRKGNSGMSD